MSSRISLILIGLMVLLPFLQWKHYYPLTDFYTEWGAALLGFCAILFNFRHLGEMPKIALTPLLLVLLVWLQFLLGMIDYSQHAVLVTLYLTWGSLIAVLGYGLRRQFGLANVAGILAWFILTGGMLNGVAAIVQHYDLHPFFGAYVTPDSAETVYGNLAQQNHFSDYVSLALASLLYLSSSKRIPNLAALPIGLFLLYALALSGSRSAWLYLGVLTMLAFFHFRKERNRILLYGSLLLIPAFALTQLIAHLHIFGSLGAVTSADRLLVLAKDGGIRLYLWREAWLMFLKAPILGVGFGQFAWHHFMYGPVFNDPQIAGLYSNAHDIILHLLAEAGLAGVSIAFGGLLFWARRIRMPFDLHAWWLYSLVAIVLLHSLDEYPLWYAQFLGPFMLLLGLGEAESLRFPLHPALLAVSLALGGYALTFLMKDYLDLEGVLYPRYHSGKPPLGHDALYKALYHFRGGTLLEPYVEYPMAEMTSVDASHLSQKLELSRRAVRFSPSGIIVFRYAALLALDGKIDAAKLELDRAASSDPDLLEEAGELYSDLAESMPKQFDPLVEEINIKLKERNIAFHHK